MKKNGVKKSVYTCRKCSQDDFRSSMEFTKHLKKCTGPAHDPGPGPAPKENSATLDALFTISRQVGLLKEQVDTLIKRLA